MSCEGRHGKRWASRGFHVSGFGLCLRIWFSEFQRVSEFVKTFVKSNYKTKTIWNCFNFFKTNVTELLELQKRKFWETFWGMRTSCKELTRHFPLRWLVLPLQHQNILNMWSSHKPWKLHKTTQYAKAHETTISSNKNKATLPQFWSNLRK